MGIKTGIQWTDHTFNPWWICAPISPGCAHCYAEVLARRFGYGWGEGVPRRVFGDNHWQEPLKWNQKAELERHRARVFCASMADVFDPDGPPYERARLWPLIKHTPWLDWQILTKRPENIASMLPEDWEEGYPNVWLGTTVESQRYIGRVGVLTAIPAAIHFVSYEPGLSLISLGNRRVDWLIVGGESGPNARPFEPAWARQVIAECRRNGVAVFVKQMGSVWARQVGGRHSHGGAPGEWPRDLRIREMPAPRPTLKNPLELRLHPLVAGVSVDASQARASVGS